MRIKTYIQGELTDRELFGLVGRQLVDKDLHDALGTAITAVDGDVWWVATNSKSELRGFMTARLLQNNSLHMRFLYCADDALLICRTLISRVIDYARQADYDMLWTNDRGSSTIWIDFGFVAKPRVRGTFVRWEKNLKP